MVVSIPSAPDGLSMDYLHSVVGGELFLRYADANIRFGKIATDSREADGNTLFVAMKGEVTDGHLYMEKAASCGVCCFLCDHVPEDLKRSDYRFAAVVVNDPIQALNQLAADRLDKKDPDMLRVAVTGSVGKTTTKHCIATLLKSRMSCYAKNGNYNSIIGLPLCLMEMGTGLDGGVFEMGMSARGEISMMSGTLRPDIGVITNIGSSHLEHLGTRENIARAKLEILDGMKSGGVLVIDADEPLLREKLQDPAIMRPDVRVFKVSMTDPAADCYVRVGQADGNSPNETAFSVTFPDGMTRHLRIPAPGVHMAKNAAMAVSVAYLCGFVTDTDDWINDAFSGYSSPDMRQRIRTVAGITLIEDCYNAAPESVRAALDVLKRTADSAGKPVRTFAVLGDMRELGTNSERMHRQVGAACVSVGLDVLYAVGELGSYVADGASDAGMACDSIHRYRDTDTQDGADDLVKCLADSLRPGDVLLVKASRAMKLERIIGQLSAMLEKDTTAEDTQQKTE